jgi:hypothetical protein
MVLFGELDSNEIYIKLNIYLLSLKLKMEFIKNQINE